MDVVVKDVPVKFGMLLLRSWVAKLKGTLQMHMSYATILVFGEQKRLDRENGLAYMISNPEHLENHPIYSVETNLEYAIFCNDVSNEQYDYEKILKQGKEEDLVLPGELEILEEK